MGETGAVIQRSSAGRARQRDSPPSRTRPASQVISRQSVHHAKCFESRAVHETGAGGEVQLTDAMLRLLSDQPFHALEYQGTTYDCGDPVGLLRLHGVRPGLTVPGEISVRCRRGAERMVELDCDYSKTWSIWRDAVILCRTFVVLLIDKTGAH